MRHPNRGATERVLNSGTFRYRAIGKSTKGRINRIVRANNQLTAANKVVDLLRPIADWKLILITDSGRAIEHWLFDPDANVMVVRR